MPRPTRSRTWSARASAQSPTLPPSAFNGNGALRRGCGGRRGGLAKAGCAEFVGIVATNFVHPPPPTKKKAKKEHQRKRSEHRRIDKGKR